MLLFEKTFRVNNPIIGMCHLKPLPGEPLYDEQLGIEHIINNAKNDIITLQTEGVHGILFSNEFGFPYTQRVPRVTVATMASVIGELKKIINIPFGIDCMYDAYSTIDLAIATEADFYRITLNTATIYDFELGCTPLGDYSRYAVQRNIKKIGIVNVTAPIESSFKRKSTMNLLHTIMKQSSFNVLCMSAKSIMKICETNLKELQELTRFATIMCDGGCNINNIDNISKHTCGIIIGTALKEKMELHNPISAQNVKEIIKRHDATNL